MCRASSTSQGTIKQNSWCLFPIITSVQCFHVCFSLPTCAIPTLDQLWVPIKFFQIQPTFDIINNKNKKKVKIKLKFISKTRSEGHVQVLVLTQTQTQTPDSSIIYLKNGGGSIPCTMSSF